MSKVGGYTGMEIAVIGMSCRFPGAGNVDEFWDNIKNGVESIRFFTDEELIAAGVDPALIQAPNYVKAKGVLEDVDGFDASFFDYSPKEAQVMDPQIRIFHQTVWEALESAGYVPDQTPGAVGLYAGASPSIWQTLPLIAGAELASEQFSSDILVNRDYMCSQIAYKLNLKGPVVSLQTACSTSLVAIHMACRALLTNECKLAVAGGVSVTVPHHNGYLYQEGLVYSPDGHLRAFDADAKGSVRGEGAGAVVLKLLKNALADGDAIHAVIKGSAINNDGFRKVGYTAPSIEGQADTIRSAHRIAKVEAESITYVETHGTGTIIGDPIEMASLRKAFNSQKTGYCAVGSVKSNIGHLDVAAGVAGFIKTVLALKHQSLPPSINFSKPNPQIDFANSPFYVNTELLEWNRNDAPLRAGVSSFGIGGTNAHIIVEEAPAVGDAEAERLTSSSGVLIPLSAKSQRALQDMTGNLLEALRRNRDISLRDVAYTLQSGRKAWKYRRAFAAGDVEQAIGKLAAFQEKDREEGSHAPSAIRDAHKRIVFLFPGQGSQYIGMGRELYASIPSFREDMDHGFNYLQSKFQLDIKRFIYPPEDASEEERSKLDKTSITQPAMFIISYALSKLLERLGVTPNALIGYSFGEYVAACMAGVMSLEDALTLIAIRGKLMEEVPLGAMLSVPLSEELVQPLLDEELSLAVVNGASCIVAGTAERIEELEQQLKSRRVLCMRIKVTHAGHSHLMDGVLKRYEEAVKGVALNKPEIPFISSITGRWVSDAEATDPMYWVRHIRDTVRFSAGIAELAKPGGGTFVEVGPGKDLSLLIAPIIKPLGDFQVIDMVRTSVKEESDMLFLMGKLAQLWMKGTDLNWKGLFGDGRKLPLPTYPFEKRPFNQNVQESVRIPRVLRRGRGEAENSHSGPASRIYYIPVWKRSRDLAPRLQAEKSSSRWLVFEDASGIGTELAQRLRRVGHEVVSVTAGEQFLMADEYDYRIRAGVKEDYTTLLERLADKGRLPQTIVHAWGISGHSEQTTEESLIDERQQKGFYSLISLAQALGLQSGVQAVECIVLTNQMQEVNAGELTCPEKATVLGPVKVIPQEYPAISCRSVDILLPVDERQRAAVMEQLMNEIVSAAEDEEIAYRGKWRYTKQFRAIDLQDEPENGSLIRDQGVYLITGGLGGAGFEVAQYLAKHYRAKLVLLNRTEFPPREAWNDWLLDEGRDAKVKDHIRKVRELELWGSEVLAVSADVTSERQMKQAVSLAVGRFHHIDGVIHAAGLSDGAVIQQRSDEFAGKVLAPKLNGTYVLDEALSGQPLDFIVLFSSTTAIHGMFGQVAYTAANAHLDAYAYTKRNRDGVFAVSINWDRWNHIGIAREAERLHLQLSGSPLEGGLEAPQALEAFALVLKHNFTRISVSTMDVSRKQQKLDMSKARTLNLEQVAVSQDRRNNQFQSRPELDAEYEEPQTELERALAGIWSRMFGFEKIGALDDFFELGGHSLLTINLMVELEKLHIDLDRTTIYKYPTIRLLAAFIEKGEASSELEAAAGQEAGGTGLCIPEGQCSRPVAGSQIREVHGIEPFNDIFYKDCFYNSSFPVIRCFDRSIFPILTNDVLVYSNRSNDREMSVGLEFVACEDVVTVLEREQIRSSSQIDSVDLIQDIKRAIDRQRPVIVWVDCFYEPIRKDLHRKEHWPHTLLVYGYDEEKHEFLIIEHLNINGLTYAKHRIGYSDLHEAYRGYQHHFNQEKGITFFEFWSEAGSDAAPASLEQLRLQYVSRLDSHREQIAQGIRHVEAFRQYLHNSIDDAEALLANAEALMQGFNEIINNKQVEQYLYRHLFPHSAASIHQLMERIIEDWKSIRAYVGKHLYSTQYRRKHYEICTELLEGICEAERQLYVRLKGESHE